MLDDVASRLPLFVVVAGHRPRHVGGLTKAPLILGSEQRGEGGADAGGVLFGYRLRREHVAINKYARLDFADGDAPGPFHLDHPHHVRARYGWG